MSEEQREEQVQEQTEEEPEKKPSRLSQFYSSIRQSGVRDLAERFVSKGVYKKRSKVVGSLSDRISRVSLFDALLILRGAATATEKIFPYGKAGKVAKAINTGIRYNERSSGSIYMANRLRHSLERKCELEEHMTTNFGDADLEQEAGYMAQEISRIWEEHPNLVEGTTLDKIASKARSAMSHEIEFWDREAPVLPKKVKKSLFAYASSYFKMGRHFLTSTQEIVVPINFKPDWKTPFEISELYAQAGGYPKTDEKRFLAHQACMGTGDPLFMYSALMHRLQCTVSVLFPPKHSGADAFRSAKRSQRTFLAYLPLPDQPMEALLQEVQKRGKLANMGDYMIYKLSDLHLKNICREREGMNGFTKGFIRHAKAYEKKSGNTPQDE